jgi:NAD(P)-dependent dehydrogenase (short-subunit alcohol dehydrogenase family)
VDVCHSFDTVPYDGATEADLAETVKQVEELDRRILAQQADVRDLSALQRVAEQGLSQFGQIDIVRGISSPATPRPVRCPRPAARWPPTRGHVYA